MEIISGIVYMPGCLESAANGWLEDCLANGGAFHFNDRILTLQRNDQGKLQAPNAG